MLFAANCRLLYYGIRYNSALAALSRCRNDVWLALHEIHEEIVISRRVDPYLNLMHIYRPRIVTRISK